jgi:16S rRNA (adenine1518-N6/adenine1519-N6)-dimethyltransferase
MEDLSEKQIKEMLAFYKIKRKDHLGQNFLVNFGVLDLIVEAADLTKKDTVIEVGPGIGNMTCRLAEKAGKVIAVEKDPFLIPPLSSRLNSFSNVDIANKDILKFDFSSLPKKFKVVANIPYYLTSKLIQLLMTLPDKPGLIVLLVQKEVGERIAAKPGDMSVLGVSVQFFADASMLVYVPKEDFWPKPEVDSCVIKIIPKKKFLQVDDEKFFFRMVKAAFAGKRKQIHNTLSGNLKIAQDKIEQALKAANLDPKTRPQELSLKDWTNLYQSLKNIL